MVDTVSDEKSVTHLNSFCELSPALSSLQVYLWTNEESQTTLADQIQMLETLFKSDDGKFKLHIRHKVSKAIVASIVIKDTQMGIKIKPALTQYSALDPNTLLFRFMLDSSRLNIAALCRAPRRSSAYNGQKTTPIISCAWCQHALSRQTDQLTLTVKSAPSANYQEVVGLWACHDEDYDQFFDKRTKELRVPTNTLLFNFNVLEVHQSTPFSETFPLINNASQSDILTCQNCSKPVGQVDAANPVKLSAASLVSSQRQDMDQRAEVVSQALTYRLFTRCLHQFSELSQSEFESRLKMCIYNHCIEDRQKNLALIAQTDSLCRIVTIKPLSHLAYVISEAHDQSANASQEFNEANKVLFSEISYQMNDSNRSQATGMIDFVKQISSVRYITDAEYEETMKTLRKGQQDIPKSIHSVKKGLYQLTYIQ